MMPPLFAQFDEDFGNRLNAGHPSEDFATYGAHITKFHWGRGCCLWYG
jgi:hypothetical protein